MAITIVNKYVKHNYKVSKAGDFKSIQNMHTFEIQCA